MTWPESQFFAHLEGVYFCPDKNIWFVPENLIKREEDAWEDYYGGEDIENAEEQ